MVTKLLFKKKVAGTCPQLHHYKLQVHAVAKNVEV